MPPGSKQNEQNVDESKYLGWVALQQADFSWLREIPNDSRDNNTPSLPPSSYLKFSGMLDSLGPTLTDEEADGIHRSAVMATMFPSRHTYDEGLMPPSNSPIPMPAARAASMATTPPKDQHKTHPGLAMSSTMPPYVPRSGTSYWPFGKDPAYASSTNQSSGPVDASGGLVSYQTPNEFQPLPPNTGSTTSSMPMSGSRDTLVDCEFQAKSGFPTNNDDLTMETDSICEDNEEEDDQLGCDDEENDDQLGCDDEENDDQLG